MSIKEIVTKLDSLGETIKGFITDKTKATDTALAAFSLELTSFKSGTVSELTKAQTDLASANEKIAASDGILAIAKGETTALIAGLKNACTALSITPKEGATGAELIASLQGAVTSTLAKLQVNAATVPGGKPTSGAGQSVEKKSLDQEIKDRQAANPTK